MLDPEKLIHNAVIQGAFPGAQLAASREGSRLAHSAHGYLSPEKAFPVTAETTYDLASLTKPLATSLLLGKALENGLCDLDSALADFVDGPDPEISLRDVLTHSAGYPAHVRFDGQLPTSVISGSWDAYRTIVRCAALTPREYPLGSTSIYSDVGFILLGAALEQMFGRPLSELMDNLSTNLHYRDQRGPPAPHPRKLSTYIAPTEHGITGQVHDENCRAMGGVAGHAGLFGTAGDVLVLCEALTRAWHGQQNEVLKPSTVRQLWTPSLVPHSTRTLGWDRPSPGQSSTGGQWPSHAVGHLGFTGTSVWIEPERALIVVLITNRVCPSRTNKQIRQVRPTLYNAAWNAWAGSTS
ncbi:MAG: beta-lactamase family protein [Myxococcales bacterium]|nr:beta-lactamase family protein [Myxococcales bacterium]